VGTARADDADQLEAALDDLLDVARHVDGLDVQVDHGNQVNVYLPSGRSWPAKVLVVADLREADVRAMAAQQGRSSKIVVADTVSDGARAALRDLRWGWLDRSSGAQFVNGVGPADPPLVVHFVDRRLDDRYPDDGPTRLRNVEGSNAISGRAAISLAVAYLARPAGPPSLREIASWSEMSPQSMSNAARRLADHGFLTPSGGPVLPDLFWELARVWQPQKVIAVAEEPTVDMLPATMVDPASGVPGVALGGDLVAAAMGAHLVSPDVRPWLWLPSLTTIRRLGRALGLASWEGRAAALALPPSPLVTRSGWRRAPRVLGGWPEEHPLFAALDLARIPGRGPEILEQFAPEGVHRVWASA
jgi:hypothetical protein